jgi:indolepyruvate ferredoxin oxidoreductase beta subunit
MKVEIVCAGIGGRGVLLASSILIETAVREGLHAIASDELGMSQRGGSVISMVKVGECRSSLIGRENADVLLSFEESEFYGNLPFLKRGGLAIVNGRRKNLPSGVASLLEERQMRSYLLDADGIAAGRGMVQASNMALLGFFSHFSVVPYSYSNIVQVLRSRVPDRVFEKNREILEAGRKEGEGRL